MAVNSIPNFDPATFQPAGYALLVEIERESSVTASGIIKPVTHLQDKEMQKMTATFVRAGCCCFTSGDKWDANDIPMQGQTVIIAKYSGEDFLHEETGRKFRIIKDKDYIGVFQPYPIDTYMQDTQFVTDRIRAEKIEQKEKQKAEKLRHGY